MWTSGRCQYQTSLCCRCSHSVVITVAQLSLQSLSCHCSCSVVFAVGLWWRFRSDTRVMDPQGMIRNKLCCFRSSEDRKMSEAPCRLPNKWQKDKDKTKTHLWKAVVVNLNPDATPKRNNYSEHLWQVLVSFSPHQSDPPYHTISHPCHTI